MNNITITAWILTAGFLAYLTLVYWKFGDIGSISNSYYQFQKKHKAGLLFTLFMMFIAGCLIAIMGFVQGQYAGVFFGGAAGALFTGFAAEYKKKMTGTVHFVGASSLIIFTAVGLGLNYNSWWPLIQLAIGLCIFVFLERATERTKQMILNDVYWYEVFAFVVLIIGLIAQ
jgi:hypothetical protein